MKKIKHVKKTARCVNTVEACILSFKCAIKDGALYECISCSRLMFRCSVIKVNERRYKNKELVQNVFQTNSDSSTTWICHPCDAALKKQSVPPLSLYNKLALEKIPEELACLTSLELQLISQILPFMKVVALHTGAQYKISGQVVLVPTDLSKITTSLPRDTENAQIITLALKRRLSDKHPYHQQLIRPQYVNAAVQYLKLYSPHYSKVKLNTEWEARSAEQTSDLWNAVTGNDSDQTGILNSQNAEEIVNKNMNMTETVATDEIIDSEDEVENENQPDIQQELQNKSSLNSATCMQPVNGPEMKTNNILNIAPAEGQKPTTYYKQPNWEALCFPKLFPKGFYTFNSTREIKLSLKKYFNQRLTSKDTRFSETTEYIFQSLDSTEREQLQNNISLTIRKSFHEDVNAGQLKDPERLKRLLNSDQLFASFKNIRATPQYWQQMQLDMLAKLRQLGPYTFFLTGSAAEFHWVEVIQIVAKQYDTCLSDEDIENMDWNTKRGWLQRNPVTVARHIDYIFDQLFSKVILSGAHPVGQILNYDKRKEMQGRGTEHFHCAIHVKDAPQLDTDSDEKCIQFIDKYITCHMPDQEKDRELYNLVQRQVHHHTRSCKKNKQKMCRFGYPRPPSPQTLIARLPDNEATAGIKENASAVLTKIKEVLTDTEHTQGGILSFDILYEKANVTQEEYVSALQIAQRRTTVVMKRLPNEITVNNYNTTILRALRANMDIQYITNIWACIAYLTSYICKPEKTMSEMMRKASKESTSKPIRDALGDIGHIFIKSREVSEHEAISRILSLPLRKSNIDVQFIQTDVPENRTRVLKPRKVLDSMDEADTDIYLPSVHDKYANRPDSLHDLCLADFISLFNMGPTSNKDEDSDIQHEGNSKKQLYCLKNDMGIISKRTKPKVIRYHSVSKQRDEEMYYHRLLILYLPWRSEKDLIEANSFKMKFEQVKNSITHNIEKYEPYNDEVERTLENFDPGDAGPEMWVDIGVQVEQEKQDIDSDHNPQALPVLDPDILESCPIEPDHHEKPQSTFTLSTSSLIPDTEFLARVRDLNTQQRLLFYHLFSWATNKRLQSDSFYIFLTGGAGVGKTFLINVVYEGLTRALRTPGQDPAKPSVLMTASTGKAASNIDGMTIHSAFGLPLRKKKGEQDFTYKKPDQSKLNTMRCSYTNLKVIIADEISMFGSVSFHHLSCALQDIFQNYSQPFAGISILAVGDLLQLNPVGQSPVFKTMKKGYSALAGSLWQKLFHLYELTTIVHQKGDPHFAEILNNIRLGTVSAEDEQDLLDLQNTDCSEFPTDTVHLFRTNMLAATYNDEQLQKLPQPHFKIQCADTKKDLYTNSVPVTVTSTSVYETGGLPAEIEIAIGAPFMLTKNVNTSDHLVNGAIGNIEHIDIDIDIPLQGTIYLKFNKTAVGKELKKTSPRGLRHLVPIKAITSTFLVYDKKTIPVERKMYPGILAYGLTAHKSQGSTYPYIIADFQKQINTQSMPTPQGLAYTMLSRATCRAGIRVINFNKADIAVNRAALEEIERMKKESLLHCKVTVKAESLAVGHINIRSLYKHACDLTFDQNVKALTVLCLTETNTKSMHKKTMIPGYQMILEQTKHGLAIFIKDDFHFSTLEFISPEIEIQGIELQYQKTSYCIVVVYKPPTYPVQQFVENLQKQTHSLQNLIVLGDFNQTICTETFNQFLARNHYHQYVNGPTHSLGSTLDLIISPLENLETSSLPLPYTDHHLIVAYLPN